MTSGLSEWSDDKKSPIFPIKGNWRILPGVPGGTRTPDIQNHNLTL